MVPGIFPSQLEILSMGPPLLLNLFFVPHYATTDSLILYLYN